MEPGEWAIGLEIIGLLVPTPAQQNKSRALEGVWSSRKCSNIFWITFEFCVHWICLINEISVEYQLDVYSFPQPINRIDKVWKTIRKLERGPW